MSKSRKVPSYRLHKARNCAVVTIDDQAIYLGPYGSPESHARYAVEIAKWERTRSNGPVTSAIEVYTIGQLAADYLKFAKRYYVKNGEPTTQVDQVKQAMKALVALHEIEPAVAFGPVKLKNVQQYLTIPKRSRGYINTLVGVIKQAFRWAASEELIPVTTYDALRTVSGLKKGRCAARETTPIGPVDEATVDETIEHVSPVVADMIRIQLLTGMRPQEVCLLRPCDVTFGIDGTACYIPESHKMEHHGRERRIYFGPQAVAIVREYLDRDPQAACFSPAESHAWHRANRRTERRTPLYPSHLARYDRKRKASPQRRAGDQFQTSSYRQAIERGCEAAFGMPDDLRKINTKLPLDQQRELRRQAREWRRQNCWAPNRLRHAQASRIRAKFGLEPDGQRCAARRLRRDTVDRLRHCVPGRFGRTLAHASAWGRGRALRAQGNAGVCLSSAAWYAIPFVRREGGAGRSGVPGDRVSARAPGCLPGRAEEIPVADVQRAIRASADAVFSATGARGRRGALVSGGRLRVLPPGPGMRLPDICRYDVPPVARRPAALHMGRRRDASRRIDVVQFCDCRIAPGRRQQRGADSDRPIPQGHGVRRAEPLA